MANIKKGHVRMVAYVSKEFKKSVGVEAKERKKTIGELIEEAFITRTTVIRR